MEVPGGTAREGQPMRGSLWPAARKLSWHMYIHCQVVLLTRWLSAHLSSAMAARFSVLCSPLQSFSFALLGVVQFAYFGAVGLQHIRSACSSRQMHGTSMCVFAATNELHALCGPDCWPLKQLAIKPSAGPLASSGCNLQWQGSA